MKLTPPEQEILEGRQGLAKQKAMELLVRYGEALGAEKLVPTHNIVTGVPGGLPFVRDFAKKADSIDAVYSEIILDAGETVEIPPLEVFACRAIQGMDPLHWKIQGVTPENYNINMKIEKFCSRIGLNLVNTCAPYQVGSIPVKGEHCAWVESSAVIFCNSVIGARTNTEGVSSTGAASLVGRIPYWGYHIDENRRGTHLVQVEMKPVSVMDWGLMGYYIGEVVQEQVPVLDGITGPADLVRFKHMGASAASSGGVEMYHVVGLTPEAPTMEAAFGGYQPQDTLVYGPAQRRQAYENVTSATDPKVDFVMLGCPHYSLQQVQAAARLLEGRKIHPEVSLWIFTAQALKTAAERMGYADIIHRAGAVLMTDTCPALGGVRPKGARVAALDSCKQAHYMPPTLGIDVWFGTAEDCIDAAVTGQWRGELA